MYYMSHVTEVHTEGKKLCGQRGGGKHGNRNSYVVPLRGSKPGPARSRPLVPLALCYWLVT
jgi:hypothetical protein